MFKRFLTLLIVVLACAPAFSQQALKKVGSAVIVDGQITQGEYTWTSIANGMTLGLTLSADGSTLNVGYKAPTKGWVAIGLGSQKMNAAAIFMGYDTIAKSAFSEQGGRGHSHGDAKKIALKSAVKNVGVDTTIEFSVPAAGFTAGDKLDMIMAYGSNPDFGSMHRYNSGFSVSIAK